MSRKTLLKACVVFTLLLFSYKGYSQDKVITGKITDARDNTGIPGVTVTGKGTQSGTQTAVDGSFSITVPSSTTTLVISSVGFVTREVPATAGTPVLVSLQVSDATLGEVVVIGYGTRLKKDMTGSVASVTAKDFNRGTITTPEQLIAGKVAGVQITSNGGAPGSGSTIRIRGGASLNASNDPLIVIDGVPVDNGGISGSANALSLINPNDIESFNILKDASAAAIYGSRASNGVIIITTKKGKGGKPKFNFNTQYSISTLPKRADILSPAEFREYVNSHGTPSQIALLGSANTDWQDEVFGSSGTTDNNLSVSGSLRNMPYRVSLGYLNQNGILETGKMERTSASINLSPRLFRDHLKIDVNLKGSINKTRFADEGAIGNAIRFDPTKPARTESKRYGGYWEWLDPSSVTGLLELAPRNPLGLLEQREDKSNVKRSIGNIQFDYKLHFFPDLRVNLNLGYDISKGQGTVFVPDSAANAYRRSPDGMHGGVNNRYLQEKSNTVLETYLNYTKDIKSISSRVDVMAGYSYQDFLTTIHNAEKDPNGIMYQKPDGTLTTTPTSGDRWTPFYDYTTDGILISGPTFPFDKPRNRLISFFGRVEYTYKDKYLFKATLRRDGSSRFAEDKRWGMFPSASFAWRIKEENFLTNSNVVSDLKIRFGYGLTGQQDGIANYGYIPRYSLANGQAQYQFGSEYYDLYRPDGYNPNLQWEQTTTYNAGIDYGFLNNRISGSLDFYIKKTTDLLSEIDQSAGTNFSNKIIANIGDMENRGIEFSINTQPVVNKDLVWDLGFNVTYNENEITRLTLVNNPDFPGNLVGGIAGGVGSTVQIHTVGYPKSSFYVYKQVYDKDGRPIEDLFEDINRDGSITVDDLYRYKSPDPRVFMGAYSNLIWRKWSAGFSLRANFGNYMYNNRFSNTGVKRNIIDPLGYLANGSRNILETDFSGDGDRYFLSDYYVENASFLRMDYLNIGYNAGNIAGKNTNLRIAANIQNVFTITKYRGLDPEVQGGIDNNFYPRPRIFSLTVGLDF